jgi:hypothetical protein
MIAGQDIHDANKGQIDKAVKLSIDDAARELITIKEMLHDNSNTKIQLDNMHRLVWICHQGKHWGIKLRHFILYS